MIQPTHYYKIFVHLLNLQTVRLLVAMGICHYVNITLGDDQRYEALSQKTTPLQDLLKKSLHSSGMLAMKVHSRK